MVNSPHFHFRGFDPWSGCGTKIPHAKCVLIKRVKKKERKKKKRLGFWRVCTTICSHSPVLA